MEQQHNLNEKWSLWYDDYRNNSLSKDYKKNLFLISNISTIEEFWSAINQTPTIQQIPEKTSFHLMKYPIKPLWYQRFQKGGQQKYKWLCKLICFYRS